MTRARAGFTLIEVLIVVVIMAVLAAVIIPQFSSSAEDAKTSTLQFNLHTMRAQIELYRLHHNGAYPTVTSDDLPQLTNATNLQGQTGTPGSSFPYGPYVLNELPKNPLNDSNFVTEYTGLWPPGAETTDGGWYYDPATGKICPNTTGHFTD